MLRICGARRTMIAGSFCASQKEPGVHTGALRAAVAVVEMVYGALTLYLLVQREWLDAALWLMIGAGLALSVTRTPEQWQTRPRVVRWAATTATLLGIILFLIGVALEWGI
jgi:hypothetical protein